MYLSTLLAGACVIASTFAAPVQTSESCVQEAAHVTGPEGQVYQLHNTETNNIRIITPDRKNDYYVRPNSYHVASDHTCKFYSEATRGVGHVIGQFTGPLDAVFDSTEWAAFYECWDAKPEERAAPVAEACDTSTVL
ncbi:hypothetical protein CFE70_002180 [Pyrenophora teres f. teres 0-1]|uniref:Uncharacterized protein n=2 Tax=Pyrenophora teres f. teres TaxID=97479 RepID=E3RFP6_PYRTT|nr:hypothetical protein PTT_06562 [Pyrenophora teres f. teres 0-1]KAE8842749.1 hypothetical protein HRS9139_02046 [Pyrenophora teres f. teres]CAA9958665.1 hypothetical protein PTMSG1_02205 [Pyrenophora teres f. maculata]KAE8850192.1 hypothetical protein PTNB85_00608 [Pyrenophora teres f. teres]KAE8851783.1 hypothetical protein HRS9122_02070 [Pyrenophora teres f. teres]